MFDHMSDATGPQHPADQPLLVMRLRPHRSLSRRNFHLLMMVFGLASFVSSMPFVIAGAWPVAGFMGLDVALFYWAFRANFRAARAYEDVRLTPIELLLAKVSPKGRRAEWRFHPAWVRLLREEHEEYGVQRLALESRGRSVEVAGFLGPREKADFATELSAALAQARRGPRFS
jgi:uncharacterized membrane protein